MSFMKTPWLIACITVTKGATTVSDQVTNTHSLEDAEHVVIVHCVGNMYLMQICTAAGMLE